MTEGKAGQDTERNGMECSVEVTKEGFLEEVLSEKALKLGEEPPQVRVGGAGRGQYRRSFLLFLITPRPFQIQCH